MSTEQKFPDSVLGGRLTLAQQIHEAIAENFTAANNDDIAVLTIAVLLVGLILRDELRSAQMPGRSGWVGGGHGGAGGSWQPGAGG